MNGSPQPGSHLSTPANMADVAREAGVSIATVSRALRGRPGVGEATRTRVQAVAERLSYVISPEASHLSRGETGRVAVVVPLLQPWFYATLVSALVGHLREAGLDTLIYQVDGAQERGRFLAELPARRKVDAVVLAALPLTPDQRDRLDLLGVRVVVAGGRLRDLPHVRVDDLAVAHTAVDHLVGLGHRRIAMVRTSDTDETPWEADLQRARGWRERMDHHGLGPVEELLVTEELGPRAGARALDRLLALPDPPTAVFAYSDELAAAVAVRAHERGLRVPEDLSVMGVDGHPVADLLNLTTVDQHVAEQAAETAATVIALVRSRAADLPGGVDPVAHRHDVVLDHTLVVRASTAPPSA
ncbi:LacI family DNA-binding transcriptional regulator [Nocardioides bruguierae]|uniref:LacI family transcriptional regulator n=1 Tax=Nocardioides bruguierae TaxID=2945102 RepID=A0A9X2II26_9ACTN|nr:LacI family DNA-binding transcriptional regulator [Nocardioides bruguierae]MCM0622390.1 LacI family transcriptional regulator [Nocardioides bruguierae]